MTFKQLNSERYCFLIRITYRNKSQSYIMYGDLNKSNLELYDDFYNCNSKHIDDYSFYYRSNYSHKDCCYLYRCTCLTFNEKTVQFKESITTEYFNEIYKQVFGEDY